MFQLLKTFVKFSFFLLRSTSRSLVIGENSSMLISSMDFIRYSSRLIANTSDYNSFALGLLGRNSRLSVLAMNSSFPGLYTIFKLYLRSCNNILWSLLGAGSSDFLKMLSRFCRISHSCTTQPFCEYMALFMWVERAACSETLTKDKGLNRGKCASDGCFTERVDRRLTEQQNTLCFLNSKVQPK